MTARVDRYTSESCCRLTTRSSAGARGRCRRGRVSPGSQDPGLQLEEPPGFSQGGYNRRLSHRRGQERRIGGRRQPYLFEDNGARLGLVEQQPNRRELARIEVGRGGRKVGQALILIGAWAFPVDVDLEIRHFRNRKQHVFLYPAYKH